MARASPRFLSDSFPVVKNGAELIILGVYESVKYILTNARFLLPACAFFGDFHRLHKHEAGWQAGRRDRSLLEQKQKQKQTLPPPLETGGGSGSPVLEC